MLCPRKTHTSGNAPFAVPVPSQNNRNDLHLWVPGQRLDEGMVFSPILLCGDMQKATKGKALAGACHFSGCIQLKMWSPTLSPATPFCCLVWSGFPWSPTEVPEGSATVPSSEWGRKSQQNHMSLHLKARSNMEIASIFYFFIFYFFISLFLWKGGPTGELFPVPTDYNEKQQLLPGLCI